MKYMLNSDDQHKCREPYLNNANHYIKDLQANLELLNNPSNKEIIDNIHRFAHSLKSTSLMMGYQQIARVTSAIENFFYTVKTNNQIPNKEIINILSEIFCNLEKDLENIRKNNEEIDLSNNLKVLEEKTGIKNSVK